MRNRLAWISGAVGAAAFLRSLRRRRPAPSVTAPPPPEPAVDPRADELRRRLAESRDAGDDRDEFESGETTVDAAEVVDPEERRREVHARGRDTTERMRGAPPAD